MTCDESLMLSASLTRRKPCSECGVHSGQLELEQVGATRSRHQYRLRWASDALPVLPARAVYCRIAKLPSLNPPGIVKLQGSCAEVERAACLQCIAQRKLREVLENAPPDRPWQRCETGRVAHEPTCEGSSSRCYCGIRSPLRAQRSHHIACLSQYTVGNDRPDSRHLWVPPTHSLIHSTVWKGAYCCVPATQSTARMLLRMAAGQCACDSSDHLQSVSSISRSRAKSCASCSSAPLTVR
jgi:hypothetical protein